MYAMSAIGRTGTTEWECPPGKTCYEQCDFVFGDRATAIQQLLAKDGYDVSAATPGVFDAVTCAAWKKKFGSWPTAQDLIATTAASETCFNAVVPGCGGAPAPVEARLTGMQMAGLGAAVALAFAAGWAARRAR